VKKLASHLIDDWSGATSIEYALIALFISLGLVTVLPSVSSHLSIPFTKVTVKLMEANKTPGVVPRS
jgi:Flp pilus assembly pilin Flp